MTPIRKFMRAIAVIPINTVIKIYPYHLLIIIPSSNILRSKLESAAEKSVINP